MKALKLMFLAILLIGMPVLANDFPLTRQEFSLPPQRAAEDQGKVGFCWAYSMTGLLESRLRKEGVEPPNLSEEYLGFYHLYSQLKTPNPLFAMAIQSSKSIYFGGSLFSFLTIQLTEPQEGSLFATVLNELESYGIVPESVFRVKFNDAQLSQRLKKFVNNDYAQNFDAYTGVMGNLKKKFEKVYGAAVPDPFQEFVYEGKTYTPQSFAREYLHFHKDDYRIVPVTADTYDSAIDDLRARFASGESIPMDFSLFDDRADQHGGIFSLKNCKSSPCEKLGMHAVLAVNSILAEDAPKQVDGLLIRNSWATGMDAPVLSLSFDLLNPPLASEDSDPYGKTALYEIKDDYLRAGTKTNSWEYVVRNY